MPLHRINSINPNPAIFETAIPLSVLPAITTTNWVLPGIATPVPEIWIGYTKHGRHYLDKQLKRPNTEQQVQALGMYYKQRFTPYERAILRWAYCQVPVVQIGELHIRFLHNGYANGSLPREVQFDSLETHALLSAGLFQPKLLQESGSMFHDSDTFDNNPPTVSRNQRVLCIGHAINKKLLIWPLMLTITTTTVAAVGVGHLTHSVAAGAEVGSFVGVILSLVWAYVLWMSQ